MSVLLGSRCFACDFFPISGEKKCLIILHLFVQTGDGQAVCCWFTLLMPALTPVPMPEPILESMLDATHEPMLLPTPEPILTWWLQCLHPLTTIACPVLMLLHLPFANRGPECDNFQHCFQNSHTRIALMIGDILRDRLNSTNNWMTIKWNSSGTCMTMCFFIHIALDNDDYLFSPSQIDQWIMILKRQPCVILIIGLPNVHIIMTSNKC